MDTNMNHVLKMIDRSSITLSGIKKIINFDDKEFSLDTVMGGLVIKGSNLELVKLDTIDGNVSIKGEIDEFSYIASKKSESIVTKLFK